MLPYAPDSSYGRPEDLKAWWRRRTRADMVFLDVIYNHFGPDGNYLWLYAPQFFTERHKTPWGARHQLRRAASRPVREFAIHNALYWIEEFHLDGLRLDAVHAIADDSPAGYFAGAGGAGACRRRRAQVHLMLENDRNEARRLVRDDGGRPAGYTAQWNDDVHHVLHTAATGESESYYGAYLGDTKKLGRALAEGFVRVWPARRRESAAHLPPTRSSRSSRITIRSATGRLATG